MQDVSIVEKLKGHDSNYVEKKNSDGRCSRRNKPKDLTCSFAIGYTLSTQVCSPIVLIFGLKFGLAIQAMKITLDLYDDNQTLQSKNWGRYDTEP